MFFLLSGTEFETHGLMSFQITRGGEMPSAGHYGDHLIDFITCFGMLRALGKEAMTLWLMVISTSATDWVKYVSYWGLRSLQNHSHEQMCFADGRKHAKCRIEYFNFVSYLKKRKKLKFCL